MADYTPVKGFWQANASESAPSMATLSSQGYPTNGDPRKGTPATIPGAAWYYWVDQAIRAVIAASGKTSANPPSPTELRDALQSLGWLNEKSVKASMLDLDNIADSSLSATSTRPVQNKVVKSALDGKLSTSGGTVSGSTTINYVSFPGSGQIRTTSTSAELLINFEQGAWLSLLGKDFNREDKGGFIIATDGGKQLKGLPDGSLTWDGKPVLCGESGGFPVGFLTLYAGSNVPNGWFRCDGSTIADMATNYPKLYAVLGTNVLPNYTGRYPLGAIDGINGVVAPGLPNIQGTLDGRDWVGIFNSCTGAFCSNETTSYLFSTYIDKDGRIGIHKTTFKASNSSSIYGASTTVTPPSIKTNFLIRHD